jgi:ATP-binding cassette subfamily F protein 3
MLAAAIFAKPDLLLLDEPTNHLSILAVMWLARELATSETWKQRIVVIVSHDRHFMDEVCSDCLHISGAAQRLTQCRGNYSAWAKRRKEEQALFAKEQAARQSEIDTLREYAGHGFKYALVKSSYNVNTSKVLDFLACTTQSPVLPTVFVALYDYILS